MNHVPYRRLTDAQQAALERTDSRLLRHMIDSYQRERERADDLAAGNGTARRHHHPQQDSDGAAHMSRPEFRRGFIEIAPRFMNSRRWRTHDRREFSLFCDAYKDRIRIFPMLHRPATFPAIERHPTPTGRVAAIRKRELSGQGWKAFQKDTAE